MARRERLPLECQQPVALKVPERAVVGQHVEAVRRPLEGAARTMTAIAAIANVAAQHTRAIVRRSSPAAISINCRSGSADTE